MLNIYFAWSKFIFLHNGSILLQFLHEFRCQRGTWCMWDYITHNPPCLSAVTPFDAVTGCLPFDGCSLFSWSWLVIFFFLSKALWRISIIFARMCMNPWIWPHWWSISEAPLFMTMPVRTLNPSSSLTFGLRMVVFTESHLHTTFGHGWYKHTAVIFHHISRGQIHCSKHKYTNLVVKRVKLFMNSSGLGLGGVTVTQREMSRQYPHLLQQIFLSSFLVAVGSVTLTAATYSKHLVNFLAQVQLMPLMHMAGAGISRRGQWFLMMAIWWKNVPRVTLGGGWGGNWKQSLGLLFVASPPQQPDVKIWAEHPWWRDFSLASRTGKKWNMNEIGFISATWNSGNVSQPTWWFALHVPGGS